MEDLIITDPQLDETLDSFGEVLAIINDLEALGDNEMSMQDALAIDADHGCTIAMESYGKAYTNTARYQVAMESLLDTLKEGVLKVIDMIRRAVRRLLDWVKELVRQHRGNSKKDFPRDLDPVRDLEALGEKLTSDFMESSSRGFVKGLSQNELAILDYQSLMKALTPVTNQLLGESSFPHHHYIPREIKNAVELYESNMLRRDEGVVVSKWAEYKRDSFLGDSQFGAYADLERSYEAFMKHREEVSKNRMATWLSTTVRIGKVITALEEKVVKSKQFDKLFDQVEVISAIDKELVEVERRFKSYLPEGEIKEYQRNNIRGFSEVLNMIGNNIRIVAKGLEMLINVRRQTLNLLAKICDWAADSYQQEFGDNKIRKNSSGTISYDWTTTSNYIKDLKAAAAAYRAM